MTREEVLTVPNAISVAGFGFVLKGLESGLDTPQGAALVFTGRVLDLVDGKVAKSTGQTSQIGALVDATLDKWGVLGIIAQEAQRDIAPKPVVGAILIQNSANTIATLIAKRNHPDEEFSPTYNGKRAMLCQNLGLGFYSLSAVFKETATQAAKASRALGHLSVGFGTLYYGTKATKEYVDRV